MIFQRNDYITPKILERKSGNKGYEQEIGGRIEVEVRTKGVNVPLEFQKWTPLLEWMILELESSNPRGHFSCEDGGGAGVFLNEKGGMEVLQEKC